MRERRRISFVLRQFSVRPEQRRSWGLWSSCTAGGSFLPYGGTPQQTDFLTAIPVWRLLQLCEAEGTGNPEHHMDSRVYCTRCKGQDTRLHTGILN